MALTFWQKLRVMFRGWSRRREEANRDFLAKNAAWGGGAPSRVAGPRGEDGPGMEHVPTARVPAPRDAAPLDLEGLQVAWLDDSGQIAYYLDTLTGEVVEVRNRPAPPGERFQRAPSRGSDLEDRRAFVASLESSPSKERLVAGLDSPEFRRILAGDRALERSWYNFRNARATRAIESWLQTLGLLPPHRG